MGNKSSSKKKLKNSIKEKEDDDDMDGFFLEDWEILTDKSKLKDYNKNENKISFNNELLISQVKTDPFKDYQKIKELGAGSFAKVILVKNNVTGLIRAILSVPSHACFSVFMGYFLGKAKIFRNEKNKLEEIKYLLLSLLAPTFIHTIFDFLLFANGYFAFPIYVFYLFVGIQYIICFIIVKRISKRSEKIVLRNGNEIHYCGNCGSGCDTTYCTKCGYQNRNK